MYNPDLRILDQEQNNNNAVTECVTIGNGRHAALVSIETPEERDNVIEIFNDRECLKLNSIYNKYGK